MLKLMETPGNVEIDPYADNIVPISEGEEQHQEAVDELPQDQGLDGQAGPGTPLEAEDGQDGPPPQGAAGVDAHQGKPRETAVSPPLLDPLWAPCRELRKLAPRCLC